MVIQQWGNDMYYEWKVCNSSLITNHKFPDVTIDVTLDNFYNQRYRAWETVNAITLYQEGKAIAVLFKSRTGVTIKYGSNDYYRLEKMEDGTCDVYHGQVG